MRENFPPGPGRITPSEVKSPDPTAATESPASATSEGERAKKSGIPIQTFQLPPEIAKGAPPEERAQKLFEDSQKLIEQARSEIQSAKEKLAEFNFQTITVILGVLTLVAAIPLIVLHDYTIATGTVAKMILILLFVDTVMAGLWLALWLRLNIFTARTS